MTPEPVLVLGGGGHAKVVVALLRAAGHPIAGVLDDDPRTHGRQLLGAPILGPCSMASERPEAAIVAVGDNRTRWELVRSLQVSRWLTAVHPTAYVDPTASLGEGAVVMAGAVVQAESVVGAHCIVNTNATVDHDCTVGAYAHVASGATLTGGVCLAEGVFVGAGATCLPGVAVGDWSVVGAGAAVNRPVPARSMAKGVPARCTPLTTG